MVSSYEEMNVKAGWGVHQARKVLAVGLSVLIAMAFVALRPATVSAAAGGTGLQPGELLNSGQALYNRYTEHNASGSTYVGFELQMQADGNLVLYRSWDAVPTWALSWQTWQGHGVVPVPGSHLAMQWDGNLVVLAPNGTVMWANMASYGHPNAYLSLNYDGHLVVYAPDVQHTVLWYTNTGVGMGGYPKCQPTRSYQNFQSVLDGEYVTPTGSLLGGVYATIPRYSPWVYTTTGDSVSGWVMLQTLNSWYAQIGWIEYPGGVRYMFTESWATGSPTHHNYGVPYNTNIGAALTYSVQTTGQGEYTYWMNGSYVGQDQLNQYFATASLASEVHSEPDQMPGGYLGAENETFTNAKVWYNSNWQDYGVGTTSNTGSYGLSTSSNTLRTWDPQCAY